MQAISAPSSITFLHVAHSSLKPIGAKGKGEPSQTELLLNTSFATKPVYLPHFRLILPSTMTLLTAGLIGGLKSVGGTANCSDVMGLMDGLLTFLSLSSL